MECKLSFPDAVFSLILWCFSETFDPACFIVYNYDVERQLRTRIMSATETYWFNKTCAVSLGVYIRMLGDLREIMVS